VNTITTVVSPTTDNNNNHRDGNGISHKVHKVISSAVCAKIIMFFAIVYDSSFFILVIFKH